ncbi:MAG: co-chaperone GroES [Phycisphaerales bacterium]
MKIRPLDDRLVVKPLEAETKTASGIFLPESAKEKPTQGKVLAAGPGKLNDEGQRITLSVKKNDTVLYGKYSGSEIEVDGEKVVILRESELLGIVEN